MITHLSIKNFTIIDTLDIDFNKGMTVLTGETGAGKSITIDTLELALGARADSKIVRPNTKRCDITATFNLASIPQAQTWLNQHDLDSDNECIIRRTISNDGRSRSTINGVPCPLQLTRELGELLVNIHGQHEHQKLLKRDSQRELLDNFAAHNKLCVEVKTIFSKWQSANNELVQLTKLATDNDIDLLKYQISELEELNLATDEIDKLYNEHKQLSNSEQLLANCNRALELITSGSLNSAQNELMQFKDINQQILSAHELINNAIIQAEEAEHELRDYLNNADLNPERLLTVETRLNKVNDIARKHRIKEEEIFTLQNNLTEKLQQITGATEREETLQIQIAALAENYKNAAQKLTTSRKKSASKLAKEISVQMQHLNMSGKFEAQITPTKNATFSAGGLEHIEFLVSTNPGMPPQPLTKVASGGELSRISLAIQVITAQKDTAPTLIFDEVDVGIGGKTADVVGQLLHKLGATAQIFCVTHLPQVAAQGDHHLQVTKSSANNATATRINQLDKKERIEEVARMLGGVQITAKTRAHAQELLENNR
ncbi:MAG: DNA repair protein RecN [Gammaproteobacteria bacterium]|nr:DNA repair protein RecN [Gammaproteobacteria bacterium]